MNHKSLKPHYNLYIFPGMYQEYTPWDILSGIYSPLGRDFWRDIIYSLIGEERIIRNIFPGIYYQEYSPLGGGYILGRKGCIRFPGIYYQEYSPLGGAFGGI